MAVSIEDPRLQRLVSSRYAHCQVGEVLDSWEKQTGFTFQVQGSPYARNAYLSIFLKDTPLHKAMKALAALFSFRQHPWRWRIEEKNKKITCTLVSPENLSGLPAWWNQTIQTAINNDLDLMENIAESSDIPDDNKTSIYYEHLKTRDRSIDWIKIFVQQIGKEKFRQFVNNKERKILQFNDFNPNQKEIIQKYAQQSLPEGVKRTINTITFTSEEDEYEYVPTVSLLINGGGYGFFGSPTLLSALNLFQKNWITSQDSQSDPLESKITEMAPGLSSKDFFTRASALFEGSGIPVLMISPPQSRSRRVETLPLQTGIPLADLIYYWTGESTGYVFAHKWNSGCLLFYSPKALKVQNPSQWIPWQIRKPIASMEKDKQTTESVLKAMPGITQEQLAQLIPDASCIQTFASWWPLFSQMVRQKEIEQAFSPEGIAYEPYSQAMRRCPDAITSEIAARKPARLLLRDEEVYRRSGASLRALIVELRDASGRTIAEARAPYPTQPDSVFQTGRLILHKK